MKLKNRFIGGLTALILILCTILGSCGGSVIDLDSIPDYSGKAYVQINGNTPFFTDDEITDEAFESFSELDALGRCGVAFSCIGPELMPEDPREGNLSTTPSGWEYNGKSNNNSYSIVSGGYIYNRCHLIGFQLTGEVDNKLNLITGTRYLNIDGMLPFENMVADYVKETGNHVMYRVTPIYDNMNLVASGVLMEAYSVEDEGEDICFCVYAYNVQPGIEINYFNGVNWLSGEAVPENGNQTGGEQVTGDITLILNTSSKKAHLESCRYAEGWEDNSNMTKYVGTLDAFKTEHPDYTQCGTCDAFDKSGQ